MLQTNVTAPEIPDSNTPVSPVAIAVTSYCSIPDPHANMNITNNTHTASSPSAANTSDASPPIVKDLSHIQEVRISGGGAKGLCFPGILQGLVEEGHLAVENLRIVTGTSVGALLSLGVTLRFSPEQYRTFVLNLDASHWLDLHWRSVLGFVGNFFSQAKGGNPGFLLRMAGYLVRGLGWVLSRLSDLISWCRGLPPDRGWALCEGRAMKEAILDVIRQNTAHGSKPGLENPTFAEYQARLKEMFGESAAELRVVTSQVCCGDDPVLWCASKTPNASVADMIYAAASLPGIFPPQPVTDNEGHEHQCSDDGVNYRVLPARDGSILNQNSLGILFTGPESHALATSNAHLPLPSVGAYFSRLAYVCTDATRNVDPGEHVLRVLITGIDTLEFGASREKKEAAIREALEATSSFLQGNQEEVPPKPHHPWSQVKKMRAEITRLSVSASVSAAVSPNPRGLGIVDSPGSHLAAVLENDVFFGSSGSSPTEPPKTLQFIGPMRPKPRRSQNRDVSPSPSPILNMSPSPSPPPSAR